MLRLTTCTLLVAVFAACVVNAVPATAAYDHDPAGVPIDFICA